MKRKGEKERYTHLNAEFKQIARRDKKAFLRDQCKEIEENNGIGKTRDLFKKVRDTNGTFHAKMGTIKDRNGIDLTECLSFGVGVWKRSVFIPIPKEGNDKECSNHVQLHSFHMLVSLCSKSFKLGFNNT